jgi:hypothetical protein
LCEQPDINLLQLEKLRWKEKVGNERLIHATEIEQRIWISHPQKINKFIFFPLSSTLCKPEEVRLLAYNIVFSSMSCGKRETPH